MESFLLLKGKPENSHWMANVHRMASCKIHKERVRLLREVGSRDEFCKRLFER